MLFNSYIFLFAFMPIVLFGYWVCGKLKPWAPIAWLSAASFFFYSYWRPEDVLVLMVSAASNYGIGHLMGVTPSDTVRRWAFRFGIAANLLVLAAFKYLGPSINFLRDQGMTTLPALDFVLPLGISFWTLTQIGYLVDRRDKVGEEFGPLRYSLFVSVFPHLIAGPIIHAREIGPQLLSPIALRLRASTFAPGLVYFAIGLAKKLIIADHLSSSVNDGYLHASHLGVLRAWMTVLNYSVQLYFDFSGYSDMAIGLAGMLGLKFPVNFNSPYKAASIINFWQRWHMTLTRYLTLLLFNPVAMWISRRRMARGETISAKAMREPRVFFSMLIIPTVYTMFLAGIWHGAGLQFIVFGLLQALYISINHAWRVFGPRNKKTIPTFSAHAMSVAVTFLAFTFSLIFFRASSCRNALDIIGAAFGTHGVLLPNALYGFLGNHAPDFVTYGDEISLWEMVFLAGSFAIIWFMPNTQQILAQHAPILETSNTKPSWYIWRPNWIWALLTSILLWMSFFSLNQAATFLYFQF